jgi:anaerobic C4-dicarboxylate transporter
MLFWLTFHLIVILVCVFVLWFITTPLGKKYSILINKFSEKTKKHPWILFLLLFLVGLLFVSSAAWPEIVKTFHNPVELINILIALAVIFFITFYGSKKQSQS